MPHLDRDLLALLALGEDAATPDERAHVDGCPGCRGALAGLRDAAAVGRSTLGLRDLERPASSVWAGIAERLDLAPELRADPLASSGAHLAGRGRRRLRPGWRLVVAVAVGAVVAALGVGWLVSSPRPSAPVASATLEPVGGHHGERGSADVERTADGGRVVRVRTTVAASRTSDHEVWLLTADTRRLVSLGMLHGQDGAFRVPAGIDLTRFDLVDVSNEPRDGNPAHSGDSILRGALHA